MTRQSELKIGYDPEIGRYVKKHIYTGEIHGEGLTDVFKSVASKLFGETMKKPLKTGIQKGAEKAIENAATKTGNYAANKAGDKIIQLLSKKQPRQQTVQQTISEATRPLTDFEIAQRVNQLISGGKIRKR